MIRFSILDEIQILFKSLKIHTVYRFDSSLQLKDVNLRTAKGSLNSIKNTQILL